MCRGFNIRLQSRGRVYFTSGIGPKPFLFALVMERLTEEALTESPWTMMFADDIVLARDNRNEIEERFERWRFALERIGLKVCRSKTEYMCMNERDGSGIVLDIPGMAVVS